MVLDLPAAETGIARSDHMYTPPKPTLIDRLSWRLRRFLRHKPRPINRGFADEPIIVAGLFRTGSGLGQSARACYRGLKASGVDVIAVCVSGLLNQIDTETDIALSPMPKATRGTIILHLNAPETEFALFKLGLRRGSQWSVIGYWAWELPTIPMSWIPASRMVSAIWVPSRFVKTAMENRLHCPVSVVPHRVEIPITHEPLPHEQDDTFSCLVMADGRSSLTRKNVICSIRAFFSAFEKEPNARLTVKLRNLDESNASSNEIVKLLEKDPRCRLINETLELQAVWKLMVEHDVLLSCHRSEGFGLHLAEAMALGRCVLATDWSGNTDFMTETNSVLLPSTPKRVDDPDGIYPRSKDDVWAEVDFFEAARALKTIAADPAKREKLAHQAQADMRRKLDVDPYMKALADVGFEPNEKSFWPV